ncbi:glycosyltransferase [Cellulomonas hominis]|uniref:glycosyltransferase n=1 Tax=Cellulomonas hominis TaxID=156981 RepID=UPI001444363C|nr:glycosyltransferase [Cellulomonas hominis]NKY09736.1 glycosyltransferase [Cellulomonas hominis]
MRRRYDVTVVVPIYNLADWLDACLGSLGELAAVVDLEVVFVDDCSTDGSTDILRSAVESHSGWTLLTTGRPSGSPSVPRNLGLEAARGDWVFFLDGDDEISPSALRSAIEHGDRECWDIVRGPVRVRYPQVRSFVVDRIPGLAGRAGSITVEQVAEHQSLTCSALYRTDFLVASGARFTPGVRMGEDLAFVAQVITQAESIGYVDEPMFTYVKRSSGVPSAMHSMGSREAAELADAWRIAESAFRSRGSSYLLLHGRQTLSFAIRQFIRHPAGPVDAAAFRRLSEFFQANASRISAMRFEPRIAAVVNRLLAGDHMGFVAEIKPRLLIAGHDLKFIEGALEPLRARFTVRVDDWLSETVHDESRSEQLIEWADLVWCEWLTRCAVWYSQRIGGDRRLVTRLHRYELGRTYGDEINLSRVDAVIAIAPHCVEDTIARFGYPRSLVRYIPNYYDGAVYAQAQEADDERAYRVAIVGIAPRRKGYLRALELLRELREHDERYTLTVLGKSPLEYPWIAGDPHERAYFEACDAYIAQHDLSDHVQVLGWVDIRAEAKRFGTIISTSDGEGCHIGPGEAFLAGNAAEVLRWRGAEFIYPETYVHDSVSAMANAVLEQRGAVEHSIEGRAHFASAFSMEAFVDRVWSLWQEIAR